MLKSLTVSNFKAFENPVTRVSIILGEYKKCNTLF